LIFTGNIHFLDWLQFEGLAYRFVPIRTPKQGVTAGRIDAEILYDNVMNKFVWGNVNDPDIHMDEYNRKQINIMQTQYMFTRLSQALLAEGETEKAIEVADKMFELFPNEKIPLDYSSFQMAAQYYGAGAIEKGNEKVRIMADNCFALLDYYASLPDNFAPAVQNEQNRQISHLRNLVILTRNYKQDELFAELDAKLQELIARFQIKANS
jgi:hypothetical protein